MAATVRRGAGGDAARGGGAGAGRPRAHQAARRCCCWTRPVVASWDDAADRLLAEARLRRDADAVAPPYWSATSLIALQSDPDAFRAELLRRCPPRRAGPR